MVSKLTIAFVFCAYLGLVPARAQTTAPTATILLADGTSQTVTLSTDQTTPINANAYVGDNVKITVNVANPSSPTNPNGVITWGPPQPASLNFLVNGSLTTTPPTKTAIAIVQPTNLNRIVLPITIASSASGVPAVTYYVVIQPKPYASLAFASIVPTVLAIGEKYKADLVAHRFAGDTSAAGPISVSWQVVSGTGALGFLSGTPVLTTPPVATALAPSQTLVGIKEGQATLKVAESDTSTADLTLPSSTVTTTVAAPTLTVTGVPATVTAGMNFGLKLQMIVKDGNGNDRTVNPANCAGTVKWSLRPDDGSVTVDPNGNLSAVKDTTESISVTATYTFQDTTVSSPAVTVPLRATAQTLTIELPQGSTVPPGGEIDLKAHLKDNSNTDLLAVANASGTTGSGISVSAQTDDTTVATAVVDQTNRALIHVYGQSAGTVKVTVAVTDTAAASNGGATGTASATPFSQTVTLQVVNVGGFQPIKVALDPMDDKTTKALFGSAISNHYFVMRVRILNNLPNSPNASDQGKSILAYSGSIETAVEFEKKRTSNFATQDKAAHETEPRDDGHWIPLEDNDVLEDFSMTRQNDDNAIPPRYLPGRGEAIDAKGQIEPLQVNYILTQYGSVPAKPCSCSFQPWVHLAQRRLGRSTQIRTLKPLTVLR